MHDGLRLLLNLRERVIAAVKNGAPSGEAAERFGVGVASAIRWHARFRAEGAIAAKPMGGDRHSHRVKAQTALVLQAYKARLQVYLREVRKLDGSNYRILQTITYDRS